MPKTLCHAHKRHSPDEPCTQPAMANGCCKHHGGLTPKGIAHGAYKNGRHSKALPVRLLARYEEARSDGELIALREDIALIDTRLEDVLSRVDTGECGELWIALKAAVKAFQEAEASGKGIERETAISAIIGLCQEGIADWGTWNEVKALLEQRRKQVETEQKRLVAMQQMITAEQASSLVASLVASVKTHVTDRKALGAIQTDLERLLSRQEPV